MQRDFAEGGSLAVTGGTEIAGKIHDFMVAHEDEYVTMVATKCWHPTRKDFPHFSDNPDFNATWPPHCVAFTDGARFIPELCAHDPFQVLFDGPGLFRPDGSLNLAQTPIDTGQARIEGEIDFDQIFYKGQESAAYSGFEGIRVSVDAPKNDLRSYLDDRRIKHVDIVGLATDYCVFATARDANLAGYDTTVLLPLCRPVNETSGRYAVETMRETGIHVEADA